MQIEATLIKGQGTSSHVMKTIDLKDRYKDLNMSPVIGTLNLDIDRKKVWY